ncbi:M20/M25/M40 family metallo-hydrolase [Kutzneria kofuensis]|uniref:Acetylornithine deacetylase/succinyl-diaminopimelate desuccinylase-like protein n=1 Tax=Kutzneria kofuensis TaxID=103725 RepID=A0A7W9KRH0_9PSEU|nr:M20/M25/M40 family metallo-hydrolase [Kutzneria kofuensis]MBB5897359.1 acetylornithine deacetylase/succinyl-diaminopimelate desuccinylase-like protein [Kutzneria kofuensis]
MDAIEEYVARHGDQHERELAAWVAAPSVSATGEGMAEAADHARDLLVRSGLAPRVVETGGWPLVVGHGTGPAGSPHVVIYGHYDVQPAGPLAEWDSPPFEAVIRDGRMYGRGTGDNKGQHLAQLLAIRALRDCEGGLPCSVTVILDGEEEIGSPHLASTLAGMRKELNADVALYSDGPVNDGYEPTVSLGVRGVVSFEIVVRGAGAVFHSGNWGNVAPNPAWELVWLLGTMRAPDGRVLVEGYDDGVVPLTEAELACLEALPVSADVGLDRFDLATGGVNERLAMPTFSINSLTCLDNDEHRTVIPAVAVARCDMRLACGQRTSTVVDAVQKHVARHLPHAEVRFKAMMEPSRTLPDAPFAKVVLDAVGAAAGRPALFEPAMGGSLPIAGITDGLGLPCYGIQLANVDERNHAPNENFELRRFHAGIVTAARVLQGIGRSE